MISFLSTQRKKVAVILLVIFISNIVSPMISYSKPMPGGGNPVADALAKYVDPFTGDFSYSVPLMNVTGPNGENYPITINYSGGIGMNDEASWVGLGWNLGVGEISRSVMGVADDYENAFQQSLQVKHNANNNGIVYSSNTTRYYGPLYWNNFPYIDNASTTDDDSASMDVYQSSRLMSSWYYGNYDAFEAPNYDKYYVSGSGISGEMSPKLFQYARLMQKNSNVGSIGELYTNVEYLYDRDLAGISDQKFTKSLEFRMNDEFTKVTSNSYNKMNYTPFPQSNIITPNTTNTDVSKSKFVTDENITSFIINEAPKGNIIRYFKNSEISTSRSTLITNKGFLDYQKSTEYISGVRNIAEFPQNGIGAFQVISTNGRVYHYSLPVYENSSETNSFSFLNTSLNDATYKPYDKLNPNSAYIRNANNNKFATSWKLTAITGLNYVDKNEDGVANVGDSGYWISFDYGLWTGGFQTTFPFYNYSTLDLLSQNLPSGGFKEYQKYGVSNYKYERSGSFTKSNQQLYYLNAIHTATESAYFIKDVRYDAHSDVNSTDGLIITPKLKLAKIILVKNDQVGTLSSQTLRTASTTFGSQPLSNKATSANNYYRNNVIDIIDFEINKNTLESNALKIVDFVTNYSLCKQLYNNAYNNFNISSVSASTYLNNYSYKKAIFTSTESGQENNSGKLTLKSLLFKEFKGTQVFPSYIFDYDESNPLKNPNYHPDKQDFWGYYKSDFDENYRGHYTTPSSKNDVDAWSLKKITTPIGAEISIEYESDVYNWVGYDDDYGTGNIQPNRSFLIYDIEKITGSALSNVKAHFIDKDAVAFLKLTPPNGELPLIGTYLTRIPLIHTSNLNDISFVSKLGNLTDPNLNILIDNTSNGNHMLLKMPSSKLTDYENQSYFNTDKYRTRQYNGFLNLVLRYVYGGGTRVKNINIKEPESNAVYGQTYNYLEGVATSEPDWFAVPKANMDPYYSYSYELQSSNTNSERHKINPCVGYTNVQVNNISLDGSANGSIEYKFNNYKEPFNPVVSSNKEDFCGVGCKKVFQITVIADSNAVYYGTLAEITSKDNYGNVLRKVNKYYNTIGLNEEAFFTLYRFNATCNLPSIPNENLIRKVSIRRSYSLALRKEVVTENSIVKAITENLEYNTLSGMARRVRVSDFSEGIKEIYSTPAYKIVGNEGMGSRVNFSNVNSNQESYDNNLTANGKIEVKHIRVSNMPADGVAESEKLMVGGENNIWSDSRRVFKFQGQDPSGFPIYDEQIEASPYYMLKSIYNYNGQPNTANWKKSAEINLHDENGNVVQSSSGQNNFSSTIYDSKNREIASAKNVKRAHFTYSSFEDYRPLANGVYDFGSSVFGYNGDYQFNTSGTSIKAHTGEFVIKVAPDDFGPNFRINNTQVSELAGKTYIAKIWVHNSSPDDTKLFIKINGRKGTTSYEEYKEVRKDDPQNLVVGDWVLMKVTLSIPSNFNANSNDHCLNVGTWNTGGADAYYDDLLCSPIDANIVGTIYNPITNWVIAAINNDGLVTYCEYDAAGRVTYVKKETAHGVKTVSHQRYNFAR